MAPTGAHHHPIAQPTMAFLASLSNYFKRTKQKPGIISEKTMTLVVIPDRFLSGFTIRGLKEVERYLKDHSDAANYEESIAAFNEHISNRFTPEEWESA